jgi:DNA-binding Lrp family transcriptional regulator
MNDKQKQILNLMQEGIPLCKRPYEAIGKSLGLSEEEVYAEYIQLEEEGLIRRFGGIVDINKLGVVSTLIGVCIEPEKIESIATIINQYEGVTHNYERDDQYNLWFTLMSTSQEEIDKTITDLLAENGVIDVINLPSKHKYKTKVVFQF